MLNADIHDDIHDVGSLAGHPRCLQYFLRQDDQVLPVCEADEVDYEESDSSENSSSPRNRQSTYYKAYWVVGGGWWLVVGMQMIAIAYANDCNLVCK